MNSVSRDGILSVGNQTYDLSVYGELMYIQLPNKGGRVRVNLRPITDEGTGRPVDLSITDMDEAQRLQNLCNAWWNAHGRK